MDDASMRDKYQDLKPWRPGLRGWHATYKEQKRWLWSEASYGNYIYPVPSQSIVFRMKPPLETHPRFRNEPEVKSKLRDLTVQRAMNPPGFSCAGKKVPEFHLALLYDAIEARDGSATHSLWWMLKKYDGPVPSLRMGDADITVDMLHFLLLRVQAPDLACTIIEQHRPLPECADVVEKSASCGWKKPPNWAGAIRRASMKNPPRCELSVLVAAIMDAILLVPRRHEKPTAEETAFGADVRGFYLARKNVWNTWQEEAGHFHDPLANTWWHRVLDHLYAALPTKVGRVYRFRTETSAWCMSCTLLDRAVVCSEVSTHPVERVLESCYFSTRELCEAIALATTPGNVRGGNRAEIVRLIYVKLWNLVERYNDLDSRYDDPEWSKYIYAAWTAVLQNAGGYAECVLSTTEAGLARVPTSALKVQRLAATADPALQQRCPEDDTAIVETLFYEHSDVREGGRLAGCYWFLCALSHSVTVLQKEPHKTHLLQMVLHKIVEEEGYDHHPHPRSLFLYENHHFFVDLFHNHNGELLWSSLAPIALDPKTGMFTDAFREAAINDFAPLLNASNRVGVRLLLKGFGVLPEALRTFALLHTWIDEICEFHTEQFARSMGKECTLFMTRMIQDDFRLFLEGGCGGAFTRSQLMDALYYAGQNDVHAAVEVLASPPYNVAMSGDDPFTHSLLTELLAPGAPAWTAAAERFDDTAKRQRTED